MWNCNEARYEFGRRTAGITVLRLGWNPRASTPRLVDRLFRQREAAQPSDPAPLTVPAPDAPHAIGEPAVVPAATTVSPKQAGGQD
jgi:hypothetical protein